MKRFSALILMLLLSLTSCAQYEPEGAEAILDALVIQAWVLDEQFEGNGTWMYEPMVGEGGYNADEGYWLSDDGTLLTGDDVFVYERLEVGKPRVLAPMGYHGMHNVNFNLGYDGRVEVALAGGNSYAIISHSFDFPDAPWETSCTASDQITALAPFTFMFHPYGKYSAAIDPKSNELTNITHLYCHTLAGQVYYVAITTYDGNDTPIIEATLKITSIDDPVYPFPDEGLHSSDNWSIYTPDDNMTRFLTVELVEYGFSEKYRIEYGIPDSDEVTEASDDTLVGYY